MTGHQSESKITIFENYELELNIIPKEFNAACEVLLRVSSMIGFPSRRTTKVREMRKIYMCHRFEDNFLREECKMLLFPPYIQSLSVAGMWQMKFH